MTNEKALLDAIIPIVLQHREIFVCNNLIPDNMVLDKIIFPRAKLFGLILEIGDVIEPTITVREKTKQEIEEENNWAKAIMERNFAGWLGD